MGRQGSWAIVAVFGLMAACADGKPPSRQNTDPCPDGYTLVDDMCRQEVVNNGATNNATNNGTTNNGTNNGTTNNGTNNGTTNNATNNGVTNNATNNGVTNNGVTNNATNNATNNGPTVSIERFGADPAAGGLDTDVELSWQTVDAVALALDAKVGAADPVPVDITAASIDAGTLTVAPAVTTRYTLTAMGADDTTVDATVTVAVPLQIVESSVTPDPVPSGATATLHYRIQGALSATVEAGGQTQPAPIGPDGRGTVELAGLTESLTAVLTADGPDAMRVATNIPVTIQGQPAPARIVTFAPDAAAVPPGGEAHLRWIVADATNLVLQTLGADDAVVASMTLPANQLATGDATFPGLAGPTRYRLVATGANAAEISATAEVRIALTSAHIAISEVFYDAPGGDEGMEWIELYNPSQTTINLSWLTLGHGLNSFADNTQRLPDLTVAPGACVVVGGPVSSANNASPPLDAAVPFQAPLPEPDAIAAGIALFADGAPVDADAHPIAAVAYGNGVGVNQAFIGPDGQRITLPASAGTGPGKSLVHVLGAAQPRWGVLARPTPGICAGLVPQDTSAGDGQLFAGRRRGTTLGTNVVGLRTFNPTGSALTASLGAASLPCTAEAAGLSCTIPPGTGRKDLTLHHPDGDIVYTDFYTYESIDYCDIQFPETIDAQAGTSFAVYVRVYEEGVTPAAGENGLEAELGYGPPGTDPALAESDWRFYPAQYNAVCSPTCDNNDEYRAEFALPAAGTWAYAFRVRVASGDGIWTFCDADGTINNNTTFGNYFELDHMGVMVTR